MYSAIGIDNVIVTDDKKISTIAEKKLMFDDKFKCLTGTDRIYEVSKEIKEIFM